MPIAWHPPRWWDWCVPEDKKKKQKNCRHKYGPFCIWLPDTKMLQTNPLSAGPCPQTNNDLARPKDIK